MKILLDTCIVIDFLQGREPFAEDAYQIFRLLATEIFSAYITAKSTTDIYYLTRRCTHSDEEAKDKLNRLTRNTKDYKNSSVKVYTPKEFIKCCEESFYKT